MGFGHQQPGHQLQKIVIEHGGFALGGADPVVRDRNPATAFDAVASGELLFLDDISTAGVGEETRMERRSGTGRHGYDLRGFEPGGVQWNAGL